MKKKIQFGIIVATLFIATSCTTVDNKDIKISHFINSAGELSTIIKIPDYTDSLKIMQITDSHLSIADSSEADLTKYGDVMHQAYLKPRKHYIKDESKTPFENFEDHLSRAKEENVNLLLLTGDILNFPSAATVKYVYDRLMATGIPWLYITGNHDWHYEGMTGNIDSLRVTWTNNSLLPLYNGLNPMFYSKIINGINFVAVDNSTTIVDENQIAFVKDQLTGSEPVILICHKPFRFDDESQQPGMSAFMELLTSNSDKIAAIFTGHNHRFSYYFTGNMCQYTSMASFQGANFVVNIKGK